MESTKSTESHIDSLADDVVFLRKRVDYLEQAIDGILHGLQNFERVEGIRQYARETAEELRETISAYNEEVLESAGLPIAR